MSLHTFLVVKGESSNITSQNEVLPVQKIITSKRQLLANNAPKVVRGTNLQQLLNQSTQKIVINHTNSPNKIIISPSSNSQATNQDTKPFTSQTTTAVQNSSSSQLIQPSQPQQLVVNHSSQKIIQQQEYVNPTNQQQQIIFHGQRFVLNPGQRIQVTQQPTQVVQQIVQQPSLNNLQQITQVKIPKTLNYYKLPISTLFFNSATTCANSTTDNASNITATTNHNSAFTTSFKSDAISTISL